MLKIDGNKIRLTRGDTLTLTVEILADGEIYEPEEGDTCRFALSKGFLETAGYTFILAKDIPLDTLTFTISAEETKLDYGEYKYDVELTHADGTVETFISSTLTITGEVK